MGTVTVCSVQRCHWEQCRFAPGQSVCERLSVLGPIVGTGLFQTHPWALHPSGALMLCPVGQTFVPGQSFCRGFCRHYSEYAIFAERKKNRRSGIDYCAFAAPPVSDRRNTGACFLLFIKSCRTKTRLEPVKSWQEPDLSAFQPSAWP